jgi:hypothetical protein
MPGAKGLLEYGDRIVDSDETRDIRLGEIDRGTIHRGTA